MTEHRYFLALDESLAQTLGLKPKWHKVTKEQFIQGERFAGFTPKGQFPTEADREKRLATAGFSGRGIRGRIKYKI